MMAHRNNQLPRWQLVYLPSARIKPFNAYSTLVTGATPSRAMHLQAQAKVRADDLLRKCI